MPIQPRQSQLKLFQYSEAHSTRLHAYILRYKKPLTTMQTATSHPTLSSSALCGPTNPPTHPRYAAAGCICYGDKSSSNSCHMTNQEKKRPQSAGVFYMYV